VANKDVYKTKSGRQVPFMTHSDVEYTVTTWGPALGPGNDIIRLE